MSHPHTAWNYPIFFRRNRVFRVYLGGKLFHDFLGDEPVDSNEPEEWICSSVRAINPGHTDPLEGISVCEDNGIPFNRLLQEHAAELLGGRQDLGVLVKYLDSAIRLPMQVHPTRAFSQAHFHSPYGKAEAWLILATRPDACIYFGFDRQMSKAEFAEAVAKSEKDKEIMTSFVNRVPVQAGDVFFVNAGVIHAIGAGCLILEVQEPTDFTIQPEYWCGDYRLNDQEMYLGLDADVALDCFDYRLYGRQVVASGKKTPRTVHQDAHLTIESLIGSEDTRCFSMDRYKLSDGSAVLNTPASVWVCTNGSGVIEGNDYTHAIHTGDYFFLPAAAAGKCTAKSADRLELVCCVGGE